MNIVILAAGKGTRMHSELPKVLHPIGGAPMLGHVFNTALALAPESIVIVVGHGADEVKASFAPAVSTSRIPINWVNQDRQLGTGHAVAQTIDFLKAQTTLVLYGDVPLITPTTLSRLIRAGQAGHGMALLTAQLPDPKGYGRIVREPKQANGAIQAIIEDKDASPEIQLICEINTGILLAPTPALVRWLSALENNNAQGEFYLTDIVEMAYKEGLAIASAQPDDPHEILGINNQAQRAQLERYYQLRLGQTLMDSGVRIIDPSRLDIRGSLLCDQDVSIDIDCIFEGAVTIENGATIGPYCVIRNSRIGRGAHIEAFSHIDGADIGQQATVGPYARLRPGTSLGEGAHVGNFVEIKNSQLGARSKANHLSYLGDATIGSRVNVGAGTITCNYDGAEKHRTVIEDDAFIGSDTQLVAPVTVGRGATLGAGTTLTHDAPADELTLSRSQQVTIKGYKRPHKKAH
ncbi:MAG: bifunctional UDP-N-acetylglucosamine diphosphorylase/glucosamine-1-phosphate N-acetyltransferase GlmU [Burkholderiaceae bacterium]